MRLACSSSTSSSAPMARGVKPRAMIERSAVWTGASWLRTTTCVISSDSRVAVSGRRMIAPFTWLEKTLLFLDTSEMSSCLVTAQ